MDSLLLYPVFLPIIAALICLLSPKGANTLRVLFALLVSIAALVISVFISFQSDLTVSLPWLNYPPTFVVGLDLASTQFSRLVLVVAATFMSLTVLYSWKFMSDSEHHREYFAFLLAALGMVSGAVLADNLVIFLLFWEFLGLLLYLLVLINGIRAIPAGTKSLIIAGIGDLGLLAGISLLWLQSGKLAWSDFSLDPQIVSGWLPAGAYLLMLVGAFAKAGVVPLHTWIPSISTETPAPVMACFTALDKLAGIYLLARITLETFVVGSGLTVFLMVIGSIAILAGVLMAMIQADYRRMLAFHSVSQVGYMVIGIGTGTAIGVLGGLFHLLNIVVLKGNLFLCGGAVQHQTGRTKFSDLGGLARAMPWTFVSTLVVALGIAGVPPLNAFVSKWLIYQGILDWKGPLFPVFLGAAMFGSALTLASFVKLLYSMFWGDRPKGLEHVSEAAPGIVIPLVILSLVTLLTGIFYQWPLDHWIRPILGPSLQVTQPSGIWNSELAAFLLVISLLVGILIYFVSRIGESRETEVFLGGEVIDAETYRVPGTDFYGPVKEFPGLNKLFALGEAGNFDLYQNGYTLGAAIARTIYVNIDQTLGDFYQEFIPSLLSVMGQILKLMNTRLFLTRLMWFLYILSLVGINLFPGNQELIQVSRVLACIGMVSWGVLAWVETDLDRLLLLAATSQFGFVLLGATLSEGVALSYLITGGIGLAVLFLCVRSISRSLKTTKIDSMSGLAGRMPGRFFLFLLGALWLSGLPPFGSFFSKFLLGMAAGDISPMLSIIITGSAIITLGYLLRPIRSFLRFTG
jgi:formate hydrogenlyase subunit 3/multisubunit Na+/H+ antiporter MnhD subunit